MRALTPLLLLVAGCGVLTFEPLGSKFGNGCAGNPNVVVVAAIQGQPDWIALAGTHVYYLESDSQTVARVPIGGGGAGPGDRFCCSQENPLRIAASGSDVFYGSQAGKVHRISDADGHDQVIANTSGWVFGIAANGSNVYWGQNDFRVFRAAHDGSGMTQLAQGLTGTPNVMALGSDAAYWLLNQDRPWVQKLPFAGGTVTTLNETDSITFTQTGDMAIDGTDIYWTDPQQGAILHVSTDGQNYYHQVDSLQSPTGIALDSTYVYFSEMGAGTVSRMARAGGSHPEVIAACQDEPAGLAQNGSQVLWVNHSSGQIMSWLKH
jgi:hypothetical protein